MAITGISSPSRQGFEALLRVAAASVADPPWFATPLDVTEDEGSITIVFHVPQERHGDVRVVASDRSVTIQGQGAMRVCALSCSIAVGGIEAARTGDLLRVRIAKKSPARDSTEAPSAPASP